MSRDLRRPPPSPHARGKGCHWCGERVKPGPTGRARGWHQGREGEPECLHAYKLATSQSYMREIIEERDRGVCAKCGFDCMAKANYRPIPEYGIAGMIYDHGERRAVTFVKWVHARGFICDHITPLWTVDRSLPWEEIIYLWLPQNIQTLCQICSDIKTAAEATQRAKERRQHRKLGAGRSAPTPEPLLGADGQRLV